MNAEDIFTKGIMFKKVASDRPKEEKVKTNANAMVGRRGTVCSAIEGVEGGRVVVDGVDWKARSVDGEDIAEGEKVEIVEIDSIVLIVKKL